MKTSTVGILIAITGIIYGLVETGYFGWHFAPSCADEVLADGLSLIIWASGMCLWAQNRKST